jgi:hypothetical protein
MATYAVALWFIGRERAWALAIMSLSVDAGWMLLIALLLVGGAVGIGVWRRRTAPVMFALAAALFAVAGARPALQDAAEDVVHAVVLDVSGSMDSRLSASRAHLEAQLEGVELPPGHRFELFELSDALRAWERPAGKRADYARLRDLRGDDSLNGEIVFMTDGRGELPDLLRAASPARVIVLRPPPAEAPDASILEFTSPTAVAEGSAAMLRATLHSDFEAEVPWRMLDGTRVIAEGTRRVRAGVPAGISHNWVPDRSGLIRVRLVLDLEGDREPRNDEAAVAFYAGSKRVIQYCVPENFPRAGDALYALLRADDRNDVRVSHRLPASVRELDGVGLLVINDLALQDSGLSRDSLAHIADWVNAGGNLLLAGAEGAFGPGGYHNTPIERLAPVRFRPDDAPPRYVMMLVDISDSMAETLPDGATKVHRLREGAGLLLEASGDDQFAIAAFNERLRHEPAFRPALAPQHSELLAGLRAQGGTDIRLALEQGLDALLAQAPADSDRRLFIITDGEDMAEPGEAAWRELGASFAAADVRLDVVLTEAEDWAWLPWMKQTARDMHVWSVGDAGFAALLEMIEQALAGGEEEWVSEERWEVPGVMAPLHLLTRTAERRTPDVLTYLAAQPPGEGETTYPLLAQRQLIGRTGAVCTRSWGDDLQVAFWRNTTFQERLGRVLEFLLSAANRNAVVLNVLDDGAELVWVGAFAPPSGDLTLSGDARARRVAHDRWVLDTLPDGDELLVFDGEVLLQRLALPEPVPSALAPTGDDETFFAALEASGVRALTSLAPWQPAAWQEGERRRFELLWLPAALAIILLLTGFGLRRK